MVRHRVTAAITSGEALLTAMTTLLPWKVVSVGGVSLGVAGYHHRDGRIVALLALLASVAAFAGAVHGGRAAAIGGGAIAAVAAIAIEVVALRFYDRVGTSVGSGLFALCVAAPMTMAAASATVVRAVTWRGAPGPVPHVVHVPVPPAQWAPDPWHLAEWRWWDGTRWTEHTAARGVGDVAPSGPR